VAFGWPHVLSAATGDDGGRLFPSPCP